MWDLHLVKLDRKFISGLTRLKLNSPNMMKTLLNIDLLSLWQILKSKEPGTLDKTCQVIKLPTVVNTNQKEYWQTVKSNHTHLERWNSKGCSGYGFDSIYKIYFATLLHRSFAVIQIWLPHQSKGLIFYFCMKNFFNLIFWKFVENRQSEFHKFKFNVCLHTLKISKYEI